MVTMKPIVMSGVALLSAALLVVGTQSLVVAAPQQTRTVHVSVTTGDGVPITDLTAADFEVKEDGKVREVASVAPASLPIRMTILVADDGSGAFQEALVTLIKPLQATAELSLVSVVAEPEKVLDFTSNPQLLVGGVGRLGMRAPGAGSGQLLEAISESIATVAVAGKRPVILVMRLGGGAASTIRQEDVREALRKTGTTLYALSPAGGSGGGLPMSYGGAGGAGRPDYAAAESTYRSRGLETVLNDGSKQTGGRHIQFNGDTIVKIMEQLAQELLSQYQISYALPAGVKPSDRLEVSTKRRGARVYAPTRIAN